MNPSKKNGMARRKPSLAAHHPPPSAISEPPGGGGSTSAGMEEAADGGGGEDLDLDWLAEVFASATLDQIDSAYREAGRDAFKAAGILGSHLDGAPAAKGKKKMSPGGKRRRVVAASCGMVSSVIGKGYSRPAAALGESRRTRRDEEARGPVKLGNGVEEAEEFLLSMLGDHDELGMGVVRDVLGTNVVLVVLAGWPMTEFVLALGDST